MKQAIGIAAFVVLLAIPLVGEVAPAQDQVSIVAIDPSDPVARGVEVTIRIDVEVDFESADEGIAMLGFNSENPIHFRMVDSHRLAKGAQLFSFTAKVIPVDWGERGAFTAVVSVGEKSDGPSWTPSASARREIQLQQ